MCYIKSGILHILCGGTECHHDDGIVVQSVTRMMMVVHSVTMMMGVVVQCHHDDGDGGAVSP